MKIVISYFKDSATLETFADKHNLTMQVIERDPEGRGRDDRFRFYAEFEDVVAVHPDGFVVTCIGEGPSADDAIVDYMNKISGKDLWLPSHVRITAPRFSCVK